MTGDHLHFKHTALSITERCTLKCTLCQAYIPYHDNPRDLTLAEIELILHRYFAIVSSVNFFCITGGEPLLHPDLITILKTAFSYSNQINRSIDIITNGSLFPTEEPLNFLAKIKTKIRVIISDYGKFSLHAKKLQENLKSLGINNRIDNYHGESPLYVDWIDFRDHSLKHVTQREIDEKEKNCFYGGKKRFPIRNGELHNCSRSYWWMLNNIVPRIPVEYIDLLDTTTSIEKQQETLKKLQNKTSVTSRAFCCGANNHSKRYFPAEQLQ